MFQINRLPSKLGPVPPAWILALFLGLTLFLGVYRIKSNPTVAFSVSHELKKRFEAVSFFTAPAGEVEVCVFNVFSASFSQGGVDARFSLMK